MSSPEAAWPARRPSAKRAAPHGAAGDAAAVLHARRPARRRRRRQRGGGLEGRAAFGGRCDRRGVGSRSLCGDGGACRRSARRRGRLCSAGHGRRSASPAPRWSSAPPRTRREARRMFAAARACGVPVNVIDRPAFCTFQFGAIVNRSPLVVGISTDGAAPVFGQAIRSRIEALLPVGLRALGRRRQGVGAASSERSNWAPPCGGASGSGLPRWRLRAPERAPTPEDRDDAAGQGTKRSCGRSPAVGHVTLVGAGPGNPELLTLAAVRALRSADVILFDDLVAPEILDFARREAKRMLVGQDRLRALLQAGRHQRADGRARQVRQARGAAEGRRPHDLRPRRRGDRRAASAPASRSRSCPASRLRKGAAASLKVSLTHRSERAARAIHHRPRPRRPAAG